MRRRSEVQLHPDAAPAPALPAADRPDLAAALAACPFRSIICAEGGRMEPVLAAWAIMEGPALPLPDRVLSDVQDAFARGGSFLIMARDRAARDAAKRALLAWLGPTGGAA